MKNKLMLVGLFLLVMLTTIGVALADLQAGNVELGSDSQERGNTVIQTWTITNNGTDSVTNLEVTLSNVPDEYAVEATLPQTFVESGKTIDVELSFFVPLDQDSGRKKLGTSSVQVTGDGITSLSKEIFLETISHLVINDIKVDVDGKDDTLKSPGKVDEDAELGDDIEIKVEVENTFDEKMEISDIELTTQASDLDDADDLDDSISGIDEGDNDDLIVTFTIDKEDADPQDAPFTITIKVEGEDDNGAFHTDEWDIELDMDPESRDVKILDMTLADSLLSCDDDSLKVTYELRNIGSKDADEAMVKLEVAELDIGKFYRDLSIDEGDIEEFTSTLDLPDDVEPGIYFLEMISYGTDKTSDDTDKEEISFEVIECRTNGGSNGNVDNGDTTNTGNTNTGNTGIDIVDITTKPVVVPAVPVTTSTGTAKKTSSLGNTDAYLIALGIIVLILLIAVIILLVRVTSK